MIRPFTNFKLALNSLRSTKVRTTLTILGVVIGITSVTAILALSEGAKNAVHGQVGSLGEDLITVRPGRATHDTAGNLKGYDYLAAFGTSTITERDIALLEQNQNIAAIAPLMLITGSVTNLKKSPSNGVIVGTNQDGAKALGLSLNKGEFVNEATQTDIVVLGRNLALQMFGSDVAIGQKVLLRGKEHTIVGIMHYFESSAAISTVFDLNNAAFVPMSGAKAFNQGVAHIQQINVRVQPGVDPNQVSEEIHQKLVAAHNGEDDIAVLAPKETLKITDSLLSAFSHTISAVAAISIIVGGVGIMNIMLVSVTERTREIGIRKAIGATNAQILSQFMIESLVMSLTGGAIGICLGYALAYVVATFIGFLPGFSWRILGIGMVLSVLVGIIFGAWPALKAARKDPIDALRSFD